MAFYTFHPSNAVYLGFPIDSRNLSNAHNNNGYFFFEDGYVDDNIGLESLNFSFEQIDSRKALLKSLRIDASAENKFTLAKIGASISWLNSIQSESRSLTFVLTAYKKYNRETQYGILKLTPRAMEDIKRINTLEEVFDFQRTAGTEVVTAINRGSIISLVYSFQASSAEAIEELKTQLNAKWSSGNAVIDLHNVMRETDSSLSLKVEGFHTGIQGRSSADKIHPSLANIISVTPGDIPKIKEIITNILIDVSIENREACPIVEFLTTDVANMRELRKHASKLRAATKLIPIIDDSCDYLVNALFKSFAQTNFLKDLLQNFNNREFKPNADKLLKEQIELERQYRFDIKEEFERINEAIEVDDASAKEIPSVPAIEVSNVVIGKLILPLRWGIESKIWPRGGDTGNFQTIMWPQISLKFAKFIKLISLKVNLGSGDEYIIVGNERDIDAIVKDKGSLRCFWSRSLQDTTHIPGWDRFAVEATSALITMRHRKQERERHYILTYTLNDGFEATVDLGNACQSISLEKLKEYIDDPKMIDYISKLIEQRKSVILDSSDECTDV